MNPTSATLANVRGTMRRFAGSFFLSAFTLLCGCSEFTAEPTRRAIRSVPGFYDRSSAAGEVMGAPNGAVPLVVVQLPNTRDEHTQVHTILDHLGEPPATTAPATQPAKNAALEPAIAPAPQMKIVNLRKGEDKVAQSTGDDDTALLTVTSPSGIGGVLLERAGPTWPTSIRVKLQYDATRGFTRLEGFTAGEVIDEDRRVELKCDVDKDKAIATVRVPGFVRGNRIQIAWIDAYR